MPAKIVKIADLQPTDTLRQPTVSFLETLDPKGMRALGLPQVWETPKGLLISDGNQRAAVLAKKGHEHIEVDYNHADNAPAYFLSCLEIVKARAGAMQRQGIHSPYDLWAA